MLGRATEYEHGEFFLYVTRSIALVSTLFASAVWVSPYSDEQGSS